MARRIIDQWNTKTIGGSDKLGVTDFDTVGDPIHVEADNIRNMKLLNVVGQATNTQSQSGPIGGTMQLIQKTYTSTGDDEDFFKPTEGVWQLLGGDTLSSGGTGSINWSYKDDDGVYSFIFKTSVNGQEPIFQDSQNNNIGHALYITPECWLHANIISVVTSIRPTLAFIRVR